MARSYRDSDSVTGPAQKGFDVSPDPAQLTEPTRFVMVDTDGTTITGVLMGDGSSHTTFALKAGVVYPFRFKTITAVTGGLAKGYY